MINTNNFFKRNTSIRNPAAPYKKGKFVDESLEYKSRVFSRVQESPITKTLLSMRKNVLGIENALKGLFELDKKKQATDQKFDTIERQEGKDKPKVKPKTSKIFGDIIQRPKTGVMDAIRNFVTFTFLGWIFTRLQPFIDKAGGLVPLLEGIMKFFSGLIVGTLDALASFLKFGYDAKDTFDKKIEEIKKETKGIGKHFDNTLGELKAVFSGAIEVVNSFLNTSVDEEELKTARQDVPQDSSETNIPPPPKLPNVATVSPSSNINGDSPIGKGSPQPAPMSITSPTITKVNTGGRIDPTKTPITRGPEQKERRVIRRKPDIQQQKTVPGKDVGGEDKVKEVYGEEAGTFKPDFIPNSIFFRTENKSGYAGLLKAAEEYKKPNDRDILGLGNLMGATVDTALGQKLERRTITQFADGIRYLVDQGMSNPEEFKKIDLELMIRRIVEPKIEAAINKIRDEVNKKSKEKLTDYGPSLDGFGDGEFPDNVGDYLDLINLITATESQGHGLYDAFNTGGRGSAPKGSANSVNTPVGGILRPLSQRTVGEIMTMHSRGQIHATGRYQIIATTLKGLMDGAYGPTGVTKDDMFNAETQDKLAIALIKGRLRNPTLQNFRNEWTGLKNVPDNVLKAAIEKAKMGRIYSTSQDMVEGGTLPSSKIGSKAGMRLHPIHGVLRMHSGNDYPMRTGTPISSAVGGEVVYASTMGGYGNTVDIRHPDGSMTRYAHLHRMNVRVGQKISPGTKIGEVGSTGDSTGPHLHFEYRDSRGNVVTDWQRLNQIADRKFRFGGNVRPSKVPNTSTSDPRRQIPQTPGQKPQFTSFRQVGDAIKNLKPGQTLTVNGVGKITRDKNGTPIYHVDGRGQVPAVVFMSEFEKRKGIASPTQSQTQPRSQNLRSGRRPESNIITPEKALQYKEKIKSLKPGSGQTVTIPGVGWIKAGRNLRGEPVTQYFYPNTIIRMESEEFERRIKQLASPRASLNIKPPSPILPEEKYDDLASQRVTAIQPIIIKELVPVSNGSGSIIAFAPPSVSPNYKSQSLSRA
jgi:murein DD-endopeptidase MepM/ murein hydrolase activator NlpD